MSGTIATQRRKLVVVSEVLPSEQSLSGFAARLHHFLLAAGERLDVTLVWTRRPDQHEAPGTVGAPVVLDMPIAPWAAPGMRGRMLRGLIQYPLDPLPFDCYPRRWPELRRLLEDERPDLVAFYLPTLAHLAEHAPPGVPVLGILEEGWERLVAASLDPSRKTAWLARREAKRFARVYRRMDRRASAIVAISDKERDWFARIIDATKVVVLPHGIDSAYFKPGEPSHRDVDVVVVGDLRSPRNHIGALRAWDAARADPATSDWRWAFVGEVDGRAASVLRAGGALVTGRVEDVRPYYDRSRVALVPALSGTGVKTTSLQAWAMAVPLVATPVGAIGLPARPSENVLVGETPAGLVEHIAAVLASPELGARLAAGGRRAAETDCDLGTIARRFRDLCSSMAGAEGVAAATLSRVPDTIADQ